MTPDRGAGEPLSDPERQRSLSESVYQHLRAIARRQMEGERRGHTLTATALVHEAYLKLGPSAETDQAGFYHAAAAAMRRILIDHARARGSDKRGGDWIRLELIEGVAELASDAAPEDLLALDEAIRRLEEQDPDASAVVRLRFYAGLSGDKTAEVLGISERQVDREWAFARAFLTRILRTDRGAR